MRCLVSFRFKLNCSLLNRIFIVDIESPMVLKLRFNPHCDWDLPITGSRAVQLCVVLVNYLLVFYACCVSCMHLTSWQTAAVYQTYMRLYYQSVCTWLHQHVNGNNCQTERALSVSICLLCLLWCCCCIIVSLYLSLSFRCRMPSCQCVSPRRDI